MSDSKTNYNILLKQYIRLEKQLVLMFSKLNLMGKNHSDELYTPDYVFDILKPYVPMKSIIYECAVGTGKLKRKMQKEGYKVIASNDFLNDDRNDFDIIVTNPPYSGTNKDDFLKKAYLMGKPFAFLLPITALEGLQRQVLYHRYGIQLLFPKRRIDFNGKKAPHYYCAWFCHKLLPETLVYEIDKEMKDFERIKSIAEKKLIEMNEIVEKMSKLALTKSQMNELKISIIRKNELQKIYDSCLENYSLKKVSKIKEILQ